MRRNGRQGNIGLCFGSRRKDVTVQGLTFPKRHGAGRKQQQHKQNGVLARRLGRWRRKRTRISKPSHLPRFETLLGGERFPRGTILDASRRARGQGQALQKHGGVVHMYHGPGAGRHGFKIFHLAFGGIMDVRAGITGSSVGIPNDNGIHLAAGNFRDNALCRGSLETFRPVATNGFSVCTKIKSCIFVVDCNIIVSSSRDEEQQQGTNKG